MLGFDRICQFRTAVDAVPFHLYAKSNTKSSREDVELADVTCQTC